jgi:hypothetical protein
MSVFRTRAVACPHCAAIEERSVALSINAARRRDVRAAIIEDRFQRFVCATCARDYSVEGPFFFFDPDARLWIGVYPPRWETSWRALEAELQQAFRSSMIEFAPEIVRADAGEYVVRAVFGLGALRDKLVCFDAALDDRALEVLKLDLMRSAELPFDAATRPRLTAANGALTFDAGVGELRVERPLYDRARAAAAATADAWRGAYVDAGRVLIPGGDPRPVR